MNSVCVFFFCTEAKLARLWPYHSTSLLKAGYNPPKKLWTGECVSRVGKICISTNKLFFFFLHITTLTFLFWYHLCSLANSQITEWHLAILNQELAKLLLKFCHPTNTCCSPNEQVKSPLEHESLEEYFPDIFSLPGVCIEEKHGIKLAVTNGHQGKMAFAGGKGPVWQMWEMNLFNIWTANHSHYVHQWNKYTPAEGRSSCCLEGEKGHLRSPLVRLITER